MNDEKQVDSSPKIPNYIKFGFIVVVVGLLIFAIYVIYAYQQGLTDGLLPDYGNRDEWGSFGDFFGGVLNPIFGFASFVALLITIIYQAKELNASTKELKNSATALAAQNKAIELQSFEQTFFSWLNTYRNTANSILAHRDSETKGSGISELYKLWHQERLAPNTLLDSMTEHDIATLGVRLKDQFGGKHISEYNSTPIESEKIELVFNQFPEAVEEHIFKNWDNLYTINEYQLDSFFRVLYRLILWVDSQSDNHLSKAQKWLYISIIRSQLSWIEMVYLYYNGLTPRGSKFKLLAEKYALFDNLRIESDIGVKILSLSKNRYEPEAYSSEIARINLGLPASAEETLALAAASSNPLAAPSA